MAESWYRWVHTYKGLSGLPEDIFQNTWHVRDPSGLLGPPDPAILEEFYNTDAAGAGTAIVDLMSLVISRAANAATIETYEVPLVSGPLGAPVDTYTYTPQAIPAGAISFPSEVAICLSYRGDTGSVAESVPGGAPGPIGDTHPRARRRGRVYLGPLNSGVSSATAGSTATPRFGAGTATANMEISIKRFSDACAADGYIWSVFSRTEWDMHTVEEAWADNAFDIQRRRGEAPTSRVIFEL